MKQASAFDAELEGEEMDPQDLFRPADNRPVKDKKKDREAKSREVQFPAHLLTAFVETAWQHVPNEFMGWILGKEEECKVAKEEKRIVCANGLWFPKQEGNEWSVAELQNASDQDSLLTKLLEESSSKVIGWIHSHPTFSAFFSSVDQHMMYLLQKDNPLAFGIVMDEKKQPRVLRLSAAGMKEVAGCTGGPEAGFYNYMKT